MPHGSDVEYDRRDRRFSEVVQDIITNLQAIIRSEVRLAKTEIREEAAKAGKAAGILAGGVVLALYGIGFFFLTWVYALTVVVPPWLASLIVSLLVGVVAAALITAGIKRIKHVDPKLDKTIESVKENVAWVKDQTK